MCRTLQREEIFILTGTFCLGKCTNNCTIAHFIVYLSFLTRIILTIKFNVDTRQFQEEKIVQECLVSMLDYTVKFAMEKN